jgi:Uma2 family endonuclease
MIERERDRFTAADYQRMAEAGVLECVRAELIDGDFVLMSPIYPPHAGTVDWLAHNLTLRLGESAIVRVQGPILLDEYNIPQPDIAVLRATSDFYTSAQPKPPDVLLVIEVADSTVRSDRYAKVPKYRGRHQRSVVG